MKSTFIYSFAHACFFLMLTTTPIHVNGLGFEKKLYKTNTTEAIPYKITDTLPFDNILFKYHIEAINEIHSFPENLACSWSNLSSSSIERLESQTATIDGKLYVLAGFVAGLKVTPVTEIYDPENDAWSIGAPMPIAVTHMALAIDGDDIWIIGGFVGDNGGPATNKVQIYNTTTDTWREGPELPNARSSGAAAVSNGRIHFFGGLVNRNNDAGNHYFVDLSDLASGWQTAANLPNARNHLSAATVNGIIYAIGGQFRHDINPVDQNFLHAYDFATNSWTSKASLPTNRSHFESSTIVYNNKIIIAGGRNGNSFYDTVSQYDPVNDSWSDICLLPNPLLAPVLTIIDDKMLLANGGINGTGNPSNSVYYATVSEVLSSPSLALEKNMLVYPNPFIDKFSFQIDKSKKINRIDIYDISGKSLKIKDNGLTYQEVNLKGKPPGIYMMKITFETGENINHKLIKL